jgi:hypothetical protein
MPCSATHPRPRPRPPAWRSHGIVSTSVGPEYYVSILSFVDKTQLEPGCSVLLHNKVRRAAGRGCAWPCSGGCDPRQRGSCTGACGAHPEGRLEPRSRRR